VVTMFDNGDVKIKTIDYEQVSFVVNGHRLKLYHKHVSSVGQLRGGGGESVVTVLKQLCFF
jgi:hypothetical protein